MVFPLFLHLSFAFCLRSRCLCPFCLPLSFLSPFVLVCLYALLSVFLSAFSAVSAVKFSSSRSELTSRCGHRDPGHGPSWPSRSPPAPGVRRLRSTTCCAWC